MAGSSASRAACFARTPSPVQASGGGARDGGGKQMRGFLSCGRDRSVWLSCVATIPVMIAARDAAAAPGDAFQQASDGLVSIDAEHHDANVANGGQSFVASSQAGASGSALIAAPNSDAPRKTGSA